MSYTIEASIGYGVEIELDEDLWDMDDLDYELRKIGLEVLNSGSEGTEWITHIVVSCTLVTAYLEDSSIEIFELQMESYWKKELLSELTGRGIKIVSHPAWRLYVSYR